MALHAAAGCWLSSRQMISAIVNTLVPSIFGGPNRLLLALTMQQTFVHTLSGKNLTYSGPLAEQISHYPVQLRYLFTGCPVSGHSEGDLECQQQTSPTASNRVSNGATCKVCAGAARAAASVLPMSPMKRRTTNQARSPKVRVSRAGNTTRRITMQANTEEVVTPSSATPESLRARFCCPGCAATVPGFVAWLRRLGCPCGLSLRP